MKQIRTLLGRRQFLIGAFMTSALGLGYKKIVETSYPGFQTGVAKASEKSGTATVKGNFSSRYSHLLSPLKIGNVVLKTSVERIGDGELVLQSGDNFKTLTGIDSVVVAWQTTTVDIPAEEIAMDGKNSEVYSIGNAVLPRDASDAIYEGAIIGRKI